MSKKTNEKLFISKGRIILVFVIMFLILEALFYFTININEVGSLYPLGTSFFIYTPVLVGISIVFLVISIKETYYEITDECIIHHRMGKVIEYSFKNIIYINKEYSEKHKQMLFYTKDGKELFLTFDKEGVIYECTLNKTHLITKDDFHRRFPNIRL